MARKRKTYLAEFKLQAVKMITEQTFSVAEVARRLGVSESLLHSWKKAFREQGEDECPHGGRHLVAVALQVLLEVCLARLQRRDCLVGGRAAGLCFADRL